MFFSENNPDEDIIAIDNSRNTLARLLEFGDPFTVEIEVPKYGFLKFNRNGTLDMISPLPIPFNYGNITDEGIKAIVLGDRLLHGETVQVYPVGIVSFTHRGEQDDKVICIPFINDTEIERYELTDNTRKTIEYFFKFYAPIRWGIDYFRLGTNSSYTRCNMVIWS